MKQMAFYPWVGSKYLFTGLNGKKILVLGESFYCDECDKDDCGAVESQCSGMFITVFQNRANGIKNDKHATYTKISSLLSRSTNISDEKEIWRGISYYNYIQRTVGGTSRISPGDSEWIKYLGEFNEILSILNPNIVIVLGERLWDNLPIKCGEELTNKKIYKSDTDKIETWCYDKYNCRMFSIRHPSSSMSYSVSSLINKALEET